jgi:hypothetical protein
MAELVECRLAAALATDVAATRCSWASTRLAPPSSSAKTAQSPMPSWRNTGDGVLLEFPSVIDTSSVRSLHFPSILSRSIVNPVKLRVLRLDAPRLQ